MMTPKKHGGWGAFSLSGILLTGLIAGCSVTTTSDDTTGAQCTEDASVACASPTVGFSCTGDAAPGAADGVANCGDGVVTATTTNYCCNLASTVPQDTCVIDESITSCGDEATPYTCSGAATPDTSSLYCGGGAPGPDGTVSYCCSTAGPIESDCTVDTSITTCGDTTAYTCTNDLLPTDVDPTLACGEGVPGDAAGTSSYCCFQFESTTCEPDPNVAGCTDDSYGFSCTSTDSPEDEDGSLSCSDPVRQGGLTLYCCTQ